MSGETEVIQLAHLLRVSAETARLIASNSADIDTKKLLMVARMADRMARRLDEVGKTTGLAATASATEFPH